MRAELLREPGRFGYGGLWRRSEYWSLWRAVSGHIAEDASEARKTGLTLVKWAAQCDWNIVAKDDGHSYTVGPGA